MAAQVHPCQEGTAHGDSVHYTVTGAAEWAWFNAERRRREAEGSVTAALRWFASRVEVLQAIRLHPRYCSHSRIAAITGHAVRTVQRSVEDLVKGGLLRPSARLGQANGYGHPLRKTPAGDESSWRRTGPGPRAGAPTTLVIQGDQGVSHPERPPTSVIQGDQGGSHTGCPPPLVIQGDHQVLQPLQPPPPPPGAETSHEFEGATPCGSPVSRTDTVSERSEPPPSVERHGGGGEEPLREAKEALLAEVRAVLAPLGVTAGSPVEALSLDYAAQGGLQALQVQVTDVGTAKVPAGALTTRMRTWDAEGRPKPTTKPEAKPEPGPSPFGSSTVRAKPVEECRSCSMFEESACMCSQPEPFESEEERREIQANPAEFRERARQAMLQFRATRRRWGSTN